MKLKIIQVTKDRYVVESVHTGQKPARSKELTKDQVRLMVRNFFNEAIEQRIKEAEQLYEKEQKEKEDDTFDVVDFKESSSVMEE